VEAIFARITPVPTVEEIARFDIDRINVGRGGVVPR